MSRSDEPARPGPRDTDDTSEQPRSLKDDLLRPAAFAPLAASRTVELVETHASWVFLLDSDVFKVKKPVDLGFLDFRTVEQRKAACDAEVVLNARLAPGVYRDVVPLRRGGDGAVCVVGAGPVVDYAVHMKRLSDDGRADRLVDAGALTPGAVDTIAAAIAAFHGLCPADAANAKYGSSAVIERNLDENFTQARATIESYLRPDEAEEVERWQRAFLRGHRALSTNASPRAACATATETFASSTCISKAPA